MTNDDNKQYSRNITQYKQINYYRYVRKKFNILMNNKNEPYGG